MVMTPAFAGPVHARHRSAVPAAGLDDALVAGDVIDVGGGVDEIAQRPFVMWRMAATMWSACPIPPESTMVTPSSPTCRRCSHLRRRACRCLLHVQDLDASTLTISGHFGEGPDGRCSLRMGRSDRRHGERQNRNLRLHMSGPAPTSLPAPASLPSPPPCPRASSGA